MKNVKFIILFIFTACTFAGCTISFQNISTHGTATDVVDDNMTTDVQASPTISALPPKVPVQHFVKLPKKSSE